jgi:1-deoxy-D-xylulose-5-phosphate reductoisomerase
MKRITILGSTGSIGTQTLDVIANEPEQFQVEALAAGTNVELLAQQVNKFHPKIVSVSTKDAAEQLKQLVSTNVDIVYGDNGLLETAAGTDASIVVTALMGSRGLKPTLAAIEAGKQIGIANKETLVSAGHIVTAAARDKGVKLLPIDSEHSAIFQCLNGESKSSINKLVLTASGGSFRDKTREQLQHVTVSEALQHPNWSMGAKITIDSASMANKGLEVIEAHWLFDIPYENIEVVLHPESIIHSMVEFVDNSVLAQLGNPDMRVPIQYALTYPERFPTPTLPLNLATIGKLHFREMDYVRYPALRMAFDSGKAGGSYPTVFNAANEIAVARFLRGEITFLQIEDIIARTLDRHVGIVLPTLEQITEIDIWARLEANG